VSSVCRVIVGVSGSPAGLRALRHAQCLARDFDAILVPVLTWTPPGGDLADRRSPCDELRHIWAQDARQQLQDALNMAWGKPPADLLVRALVRRGHPGRVLVNAACRPGDLLVLGVGRPGALARIVAGRASSYCLAHARCPVLTVPPSPLGQEARRGMLARTLRHRTLTTDQISQHQHGAAA
jgi:nucleotide-binding universal stress UspA family protein